MTIPSEAEDPPVESDAQNGGSSKSKSSSRKIAAMSSPQVVDDKTDSETIDTSLSKSKKKKKKKISRNDDSNSPPMLDGFDDKSSTGPEKTIVSTTSTKKSKSSKGQKKKKNKIDTLDESESPGVVSAEVLSADVASDTGKEKTPKKKKKISRAVVESSDVTPGQSSRSVTDSRASSKKSKSTKSPKSKSRKKKVERVNESGETVPDIERSQSLDLVSNQSNGIPKSRMTMEPGQPREASTIKRTMSLDTANSHYRPGPRAHGGRMNSNWGGRGRAQGGRGRGRGPPPVTGRGRGRGRSGPFGGWQSRSLRPPDRNGDMSFAARSSSHDRLPYGKRQPSLRSLSQEASHHSRDRSHHSYGRPMYEGSSNERPQYGSPRGPPARGRRPMSPNKSSFDDSPTTSSPNQGNLYRAPGRPASILRNSSHGMSRSSHHKSIATASSHSSSHRRVNIDLNASSRHSTISKSRKYDQDVDSSDIESDNDDSSFALDESERYQRTAPHSQRGLSRSLSGLGTNSSHGLNHFKSQGQSMRSLLTIEQEEFKGENGFIRALRYIHFLAPHPNEDPIKKKIRLVTWGALFCDFMNSLVAIITWQGETSKCCGVSIFSTLARRDSDEDDAEIAEQGDVWDLAVAITTYLYMVLIFLEVVPVMRDKFPFHLMNPFIGFLITFAVFFSDSIVEAASMWIFEALAVTCEAVTYRLRMKRFTKRKARLKTTKKEIEKLRKIKRKVKDQYDNGGGRVLTRGDSAAQFVLDLDSSSSSFADDSSFQDDIHHNSFDANTITGRTAVTAVSNIGTHRETRLLRERRQLIRSLQDDEQDLRVHFIGVVSNTFLVIFSLLMIIVIAKNGGMCIRGLQLSNPFIPDQLGVNKCNACAIEDPNNPGEYIYDVERFGDFCQVGCNNGVKQCYYPYGFRYNSL